MADAPLDVEAVYRKYGPLVVRRCRQLLRDPDEAWDVAQEVFVRLLKGRDRLHGQYPGSLVFRVATNLCLNRLRDRRRAPEHCRATRCSRRSRPGADLDAPLLLDRLFRRHPESTRTMAVLHHVDGMTLAEVARECGLSVSGVRKRLRGLRASLAGLRTAAPPEEPEAE